MTRYIRFLFVFAVCLAVAVTSARADYYLWKDAKTGVSLSFPDNWDITHNQNPDDVITIMAPSGGDYAMCRVRVRPENRYLIFPRHMDDAAQNAAMGRDFWRDYYGEFSRAHVHQYTDDAALGRGFGEYTYATMTSAVPGPQMKRRAMTFAALYHDDIYIFECSARAAAFGHWKPLFLSIAKSIDFPKVHHEFKTGYYRDFM